MTFAGKMGWNDERLTDFRRTLDVLPCGRHMEEAMHTSQPVISEDEIAKRAYAIWQARGCPPGDGNDDWQAAKAELSAARVGRNGSTQQRLQSWWTRVREKLTSQQA